MWWWLGVALASEPSTGAEWLQAIDAAATKSQDASLHLAIDATTRTGATTHRELDLWQKGDDERLLRLTDPPMVAGTALLSRGDGELHLYLPSFERVRRIVGNSRGDSFMGTDFTMEDLARVTFEREWTATVESAAEGLQVLHLDPVDAKAHESAALRLWVQPGSFLVVRVEHLDAQGKALRRVELGDFRDVAGRSFAHRIQVDDLEKERHSVAIVSNVQVDTGLSDELFTVTHLSGK